MTTYTDYCPDCGEEHEMKRYEGATVGLRCAGCGKKWAAPTLNEAQDHDPNYTPNQ